MGPPASGTASGSIGSHQGNVVSSIRTGLPQIIPSKGDVVAAMMGGEGCQPYAAKRQASEVMLPPPTPLPHLLGHLPASLDGPQLVPMDRINRTDEEDHVDNIDHDEHDVADDSSTDSERVWRHHRAQHCQFDRVGHHLGQSASGEGVSPPPPTALRWRPPPSTTYSTASPRTSRCIAPGTIPSQRGGEDEDRLDDSSMTVNDLRC